MITTKRPSMSINFLLNSTTTSANAPPLTPALSSAAADEVEAANVLSSLCFSGSSSPTSSDRRRSSAASHASNSSCSSWSHPQYPSSAVKFEGRTIHYQAPPASLSLPPPSTPYRVVPFAPPRSTVLLAAAPAPTALRGNSSSGSIEHQQQRHQQSSPDCFAIHNLLAPSQPAESSSTAAGVSAEEPASPPPTPSPEPPVSPLQHDYNHLGYESSQVGEQSQGTHEQQQIQSVFQCPICSKTFRTTHSLRSHLRCHDVPRFPCGSCDVVFRRKHDLFRHERSIHGAGNPHVCAACGRSFPRADALKRHNGGSLEGGSRCAGISLLSSISLKPY